jgi:hypothetical protein
MIMLKNCIMPKKKYYNNKIKILIQSTLREIPINQISIFRILPNKLQILHLALNKILMHHHHQTVLQKGLKLIYK